MTARLRQTGLAWGVPLAVEAAALGRSVVLARLIGPDELGRALLLALVLRLVEMISDLGVERLLVQAPEGATPDLQARLQGALLLRGAALAAVLFLSAPILALCFPDGPATGAYAALVLVPGLRAVLHLDYRRAERRQDYRPLAKVELGAALGMLSALGLGLAFGLDDHRVLPLALVGQAATQVALSHLVATRPWRVDFAWQGLHRIWNFGAPLALNAGLMFLTLQADRLIVAVYWTWSDLALYGIVAQLAFLPAQIVGRAATSLLLPAFGSARVEGRLEFAARDALRRCVLLGAGFTGLFAVIAPAGIGLIYGAQLAPAPALAAAFALAAGLRIARTPLSVLAVATARTADTARANLWRAAALVPGGLLAAAGAPLAAFAATAALGEAAALLRATRLARHPRSLSLKEQTA
jgi:O-antigen/teichoic acid export membrane protein